MKKNVHIGIEKILNTKWSSVFNETCLKETFWPTFTRIT